jgi:hypothetical protein
MNGKTNDVLLTHRFQNPDNGGAPNPHPITVDGFVHPAIARRVLDNAD